MIPSNQQYRLHSSTAEVHPKRMQPWQLDDEGVLAFLEGQRDIQAHFTQKSCIRFPKIYSFVFGLAVLFLVMTSYLLSSKTKEFFITPSPYETIKPGTIPFNISSSKDIVHLSQVVQQIISKVEYKERKLPDMEMLVQSEPHIFSVIPNQFLPELKNPCWYEHLSGNISVNLYQRNLYAMYSRQSRAAFDYMNRSFRKNKLKQKGKLYRIRCLPYFYVIGQPKCGTTDLYQRLRLHPDIRVSRLKEPHWWTRKRFGIIRPGAKLRAPYPVEDYLDLFDFPAHEIQDQLLAKRISGTGKTDLVIGEASASTMWDNNAWSYFHSNSSETEPPFLIQDFIHALQPESHFITILRDPVERLYSDYLYFGTSNKSSEDFHEKVWESLQLFDACLQEFSIRTCVYNSTLNNSMPVRLHVGLYVLYILDWLSVFRRDQLLVLKLEDHAVNKTVSMNKIFRFLQLGPLTKRQEATIMEHPASNTRRLSDRNLGPMLPLTRHILTEFYSPFNMKLADVLKDDSFMWNNQTKQT